MNDSQCEFSGMLFEYFLNQFIIVDDYYFYIINNNNLIIISAYIS